MSFVMGFGRAVSLLHPDEHRTLGGDPGTLDNPPFSMRPKRMGHPGFVLYPTFSISKGG
jgi:hypothetical protein